MPAGSSGGMGRPRVLLAREICVFERFAPRGVSGAGAAAAARLHAQTSSPFVEPGMTLRRSAGGFGIWWWDQALVSARLLERFGR
jgi:hypothetical protein